MFCSQTKAQAERYIAVKAKHGHANLIAAPIDAVLESHLYDMGYRWKVVEQVPPVKGGPNA